MYDLSKSKAGFTFAIGIDMGAGGSSIAKPPANQKVAGIFTRRDFTSLVFAGHILPSALESWEATT